MSKISKILLASVLKPVNETRMYEKFAKSLIKLKDVEIHIAGFSTDQNINSEEGIFFHAIFSSHRLSISRLWVPFKLFRILLKVKPEVLIVTTHEILLVSILYKIISGGYLIYDVQENYYRNIKYTSTYPPVIRDILAMAVRFSEILARPFINRYFLAERNYETEFSFSKKKSTVIENKFKLGNISQEKKTNIRINKEYNIRLLYSGTIAEVYGIFEAIDMVKKLHELNSKVTLTIIGYSPKNQTLKKLKYIIKTLPFIEMKSGGEKPVAHAEIVNEILKADIGILSYLPNKSTENCIPTKLYEYLSLNLPMIIPPNPSWTSISDTYNASVTFNFKEGDPNELLKNIDNKTFYTQIPENTTWESEESKLLAAISKIRQS